jgi:hypothetical protein
MNLYEAEAIQFVNHSGFNHPEGRGTADGFPRSQMTITRVFNRIPVRPFPNGLTIYPYTFRNNELDASKLPRNYEVYLIINPLYEIVVTMIGSIAVHMFLRPRGSQEPFNFVSYESAPYAGGTENIDRSRRTIEDFLTFQPERMRRVTAQIRRQAPRRIREIEWKTNLQRRLTEIQERLRVLQRRPIATYNDGSFR